MHKSLRAALLFAALLSLAATPAARHARQDADGEARPDEQGIPRAPFSELRAARRMLLVVNRMLAVDTAGAPRAVFDETFLRPTRMPPRYDYAYALVEKQIEKYRAQGGRLHGVEAVEEAELVVVYKVITQMRSFSRDRPFVYGEMYVFLNRTEAQGGPALVWRTKDDQVSPDSAVKDFLKQLKALRGER
jgi:hypothetical protein